MTATEQLEEEGPASLRPKAASNPPTPQGMLG